MNLEIAADAAVTIRDDDIIEIDAGGKVIKVYRSTLTLAPDTMLANMFSGRWEGSLKLDSLGRVFLDEDSELIEIIIIFLRMKKREDPTKPVRLPEIRKEKKENFVSLLDYYGLTDFFHQSPVYLPFYININDIDVIQPNGTLVDVNQNENKVQFSKNGNNGHYFVACEPRLDPSEGGSFWKVTINVLKNNGFLCLGIIGTLYWSNESYSSISSYGWTNSSQVRVRGVARQYCDSSWSGFIQGECLYFHLKSNKMTMYSVQKNKSFTMDIAPTALGHGSEHHTFHYIHFNITSRGDKLTLESLNEEERALVLL